MEIIERLMRHWAGLAMEGKLQWSVVRRRWFGMWELQQCGDQEYESGESLWDSEAFRRTWVHTEDYWQVALDDYGLREGWEEHCDGHECCGQEENGEWKVLYHGKCGTSWVEVGGWVDKLKSSSSGWIACWLGF